MTEEIKEILEYLKNNTFIPDETKRKYKILHRDEVNKLLNYITNLQKENEKLKDTIKKDNHLLGCNFSKKDKYKQERDVYKQRNEKAVEYIKEWWYEKNTRDINRIVSLGDKRIDLYNILESGDE